ncbi:Lsr2 family protein [Kribbella sp. NPDC056345]|uniref:histone-like nucleoid-structuring protein Lsr2 n=1 Tax=Kribbella sp. NPDC056345 TaxID=3345789 RepID=UPI0035DF68E9
MAQRVEVQLTDDLDGTDIATGKGETLTFGLDGHTYEIDLTNKNAGALRKVLSPYVGAGRRVKTSRGARVRHTQIGPDATTLREWARANGYEVSDRGRIPANVREAFEAAN